ncbi:MAG TPA: hypothetical protein VF139_19335 [Candidatus Polarisedimenticolaceae bacterium]
MRRTLVFVLVAGLLAAVVAHAQDAPAPKAVFETTTFDGGPVAPGADVQAQFVVRNEGAGELRILAVKPG